MRPKYQSDLAGHFPEKHGQISESPFLSKPTIKACDCGLRTLCQTSKDGYGYWKSTQLESVRITEEAS